MALVVYRGPSAYDGSPIRAVLVPGKDCTNAKTGRMAQIFILRDDIAPHTAQRCGADFSVCGMCPLRPSLDGGCYVVTFQGPLSTWKATTGQAVAGAAAVRAAIGTDPVRLGAYGDVAALPAHIVQWLYIVAGGRVTGYSHGHRLLGLDGIAHLRGCVMLSVETEAQASAAHAAGWRTFRARAHGAPVMAAEVECPSERIDCSSCLLCRGTTLKARSVTIPVHGFRSSAALRVVAEVA